MTDAALENAVARRAYFIDRLNDIASDINRLIELHAKTREELGEIENFIRKWHELTGTQPPATLGAPEQSVAVEGAEGAKRVRPKNPDREFVARKCVEYIREAGHPLSRSDLFAILSHNDISIRGKDPEMVLSTMLWRSQHCVTRTRAGYVPTPARTGA